MYRQDGAPLELLYTPTGGATQRYWYELDGKGNVVALTTASGAVVDRYYYDLWGAPSIDLEGVPQPFLYGGYVYDRELRGPGESNGWYWLSVRHYNPALERFLQPDPSQQEGTRSYVYAGDDPLDATDPSGEPGVCLGPLTLGNCSTNPSLTDVAVGVALVVAGTVATGGGLAVGLAGGEAFLGLDVATLTATGPALVTAGGGVLTGDPAFGGVGGGGGDAAGAEAEAAGVFGARGVLPTEANQFGDSVGIASGPIFFASDAGGPIRELSTSGVQVTERCVGVVESHLARFGADAPNATMIQRLRSIVAGEADVEPVDLNFYTHELREYVRYRSLGFTAGEPADRGAAYELWNNARTATREDYGLTDNDLYHPSAAGLVP